MLIQVSNMSGKELTTQAISAASPVEHISMKLESRVRLGPKPRHSLQDAACQAMGLALCQITMHEFFILK